MSAQVPLGLGTGSGKKLSGSTGEIASESWKISLTLSLRVTTEEDRPPVEV